MSIVTLVSGGLDSTLMSLLIKEENIKQFPLYINYGQLAYKEEFNALNYNVKKYDLTKPKVINLSDYGKIIKSGITSKTKDIFYDAFLPNRNLLFLLVASSYAYEVKANAVAIGLLNDSNFIFYDQTRHFVNNFNKLISKTLDYKIQFLTPLIKFNKQQVVELAKNKKIEKTYSCHKGNSKPCGECISCREYLF